MDYDQVRSFLKYELDFVSEEARDIYGDIFFELRDQLPLAFCLSGAFHEKRWSRFLLHDCLFLFGYPKHGPRAFS